MLIASKNENKTHFWQVTGVMGGKFFVIIYIDLYDNIYIYVTPARSAMPSVLTNSGENFRCN